MSANDKEVGSLSAELAKHKLLKKPELSPELENVDLLELLEKLSPEELDALNNDFDPDNSLLPPAQRCPDQTKKDPTGRFDRQKLIKYLEEKSKKEKDWENSKEFVKETRGKVWKPPKTQDSTQHGDSQIDPEFEEALADATEEELVDLAAVLGFHGMLNQTQYHASLDNQSVKGGWQAVAQSEELKAIPDLPPNTTDPEVILKSLEANDPKLKEVNLNNLKNIQSDLLLKICGALATNAQTTSFSISNVGATDRVAKVLARSLQSNSALKVVNIESNFITGLAVAEVFQALNDQSAVEELRVENQKPAVTGVRNEMLIMKAVENNPTLLIIGAKFDSPEVRLRVQRQLQKNLDKRGRQNRMHHSSDVKSGGT